MRSLPAPIRARLERGGRDLTVVVVRLGALGDVVRTVPAVRYLRQELPEARIAWIVDEAWSVLLDGHADLDRIVPFPRGRLRQLSRQARHWSEMASLLSGFRRELRTLGADVALDFHGNLRSGVVTCWTGARVRLGYAGALQKEGNRFFTTHRVGSHDPRLPRPVRNLALVEALVGKLDSAPPAAALSLVERGRQAATAIAETRDGRGTLAILSPGTSVSQSYKRPPLAALVAAIAELGRAQLETCVVWGPGEEGDARQVVAAASGHGARLAPPTDLPTLAALLSMAHVFIGGDTGPLHLACAVGCPVLGIYGPTDPRVNGPWGVPHRIVAPSGRVYSGIKRIDRRAGFTGLDPAEVASAIDSLLAETDVRSGATQRNPPSR